MVAIEKRQVSEGLAGTSKPRHGLFACPFCGKCFAALETCGICIQSDNFSSSMFCLGTALKIPLKNKHLKIIRVLAIAIEGQPLWRFQCPSSVTKPWTKDSTKTAPKLVAKCTDCKIEAQSDRSQQLQFFSARAPLKIEPCHSSTRRAAGRIETLSWRQNLVSTVSV